VRAEPDATRDVGLVAHQLAAEQRMFWRSREAAIFIFIFPLLLYSLLSSVYSHDITIDRMKVPSADVLLAGLFGYGAANTAFAGLAIILVGRRETGTLKRLRATPLPPAAYIVAVILSTLVVFAIQAVALLVLGKILFGASSPANALGFAGAVVLGVACFAGMGVGAAALIRSADGASAVVNVVLLPMAFLSGSFGPSTQLPQFLDALADVLPLTYFLDIVNGVYLHGHSLFSDLHALAIVAAWGVAGVVVALRRFSWMPRT
jgi:ABC-2 type transport system permease protein